jgi:hypothetical protein
MCCCADSLENCCLFNIYSNKCDKMDQWDWNLKQVHHQPEAKMMASRGKNNNSRTYIKMMHQWAWTLKHVHHQLEDSYSLLNLEFALPFLGFLLSYIQQLVIEIRGGKSINEKIEQTTREGNSRNLSHRNRFTSALNNSKKVKTTGCQCSIDHQKFRYEKSQNKNNKVLISLASLISHNRHKVAHTTVRRH